MSVSTWKTQVGSSPYPPILRGSHHGIELILASTRTMGWALVSERVSPGRTMQHRSHGGRGMVCSSLGYLFFDWQFCSFVGIRFPDSLLALILSGPGQSSPRLILGHLSVSIYVPFFLEAVSTPGLNNGFNTGMSQFTFAAWCLSCSPFHVVRCLRMTHFDDPSLAKTPLPGLKTQNSSSLPPRPHSHDGPLFPSTPIFC